MMVLFDKSYFKGGAESNYLDYTKKKYHGLAKDIFNYSMGNTFILDYGCGTGNLIKSYNEIDKLGLRQKIIGTDISEWAINYGLTKYNLYGQLYHYDKTLLRNKDLILMLDVLEHCSIKEIKSIFNNIKKGWSNIIVRVPVSKKEGENFHLKKSQKDKTHIQCHSKLWWYNLFLKLGWTVRNIIDGKYIYDSQGVLAWKLEEKK